MIANPEDVQAPGGVTDLEQLVALGVDEATADAMTAAADLLAERTARRTAELLAELVGPGMVSGSLPAWVGDVIAEAQHQMWYAAPTQLAYPAHVLQFSYEPRPEARELVLSLQLDGQRIWFATLKADRAS